MTSRLFAIYCDESCHLEADHMPLMVLGGLTVPYPEIRRVKRDLRRIVAEAGLPETFEPKWTPDR